MRYPAFIKDMGVENARPRLLSGIASGYLLAAAFAALLAAATALDLLPCRWELWALLALKIVTNTLAWAGVRRQVLALELTGLNTVSDLLVMTGAVYFTGGQASPLTGIYIIEITVIALLANLGVTVMVASMAVLTYSAMAITTHLGVLVQQAPPLGVSNSMTTGYLVLDLLWMTLLVGVATFFTSTILRKLREREGALSEHTAALLEAGRQRSQFMANISHELRTPIQGILGVADLVETEIYGPASEEQKKAQRSIKRSARTLLDMIEDLLKISMSDAGQLRFDPQPVQIPETIAQTVASTQWMLQTKELTLATTVGDDVGEIKTDRAKLNQILIHLVSNAVKFTPQGGQVILRAWMDEESWLCISLTDTGVGIPDQEHEHIFEDFRQVDGSPERMVGGMGVGLALVRRLVTLMGGEIKLRSTVGEGSTFTLRLPVEPPPPTSQAIP